MKKVIGIIAAGIMTLGINVASAQTYHTLVLVETLAEKFVANDLCNGYEITEDEFMISMFRILESAPTLTLPDAADVVLMMGAKIQQNLAGAGQSQINKFCSRFTTT